MATERSRSEAGGRWSLSVVEVRQKEGIMIELGTGDWEDLNGDSGPNQFIPQYPVTSSRATITHLQAWLKLGNPGRTR
ncbi:hypothetical protein [Nostoc sp. DedQUE09]|uniref:hypothetical protein n=1 Tax=Nostoc sp. DedQUE09 TaxID=3075394 RepID=UPI002AD36DDA|nr:hypothetical protein [Nostoc sp. DedQUE09]MDZ7954506.1 hypothetical protein [Nostoc sp. DedQUE09]